MSRGLQQLKNYTIIAIMKWLKIIFLLSWFIYLFFHFLSFLRILFRDKFHLSLRDILYAIRICSNLKISPSWMTLQPPFTSYSRESWISDLMLIFWWLMIETKALKDIHWLTLGINSHLYLVHLYCKQTFLYIYLPSPSLFPSR